jgi:hypothetical protein
LLLPTEVENNFLSGKVREQGSHWSLCKYLPAFLHAQNDSIAHAFTQLDESQAGFSVCAKTWRRSMDLLIDHM